MPYDYTHKLHDSEIVTMLKLEDDVVVDREPGPAVVRSVSQELLQIVNAYGDTLALIPVTRSLARRQHRDGDADGEWLGVHPKVGQAYMTAFASSMGRRGALAVVSDNGHFGVAVWGFPVRQLFANLIEEDHAKLDEVHGDPHALRDHLEVSGAQIHASVEKLQNKMDSSSVTPC